MTKNEFLSILKKRLHSLPRKELESALEYYREILDDRAEEGITEADAVAELGSIDEIVLSYLGSNEATRSAKAQKSKRKLGAWEIVLLSLGSPIWISLLVAAFAIVISVYVVLWSFVVTVWAVFASFAACGLAGVVVSPVFFAEGGFGGGMLVLGCGALLAGLAVFLFFASHACTKGMARVSVIIWNFLVRCFVGRRNVA